MRSRGSVLLAVLVGLPLGATVWLIFDALMLVPIRADLFTAGQMAEARAYQRQCQDGGQTAHVRPRPTGLEIRCH